MPLKVTHVNYSNTQGGAARAVYRLHKALLSHGIDSMMRVTISNNIDKEILSNTSSLSKLVNRVRPVIGNLPEKFFKSDNPVIHSPALLPSSLVKVLNKSDSDIIHLHWFNSEMLSIADLSKIKKPVIWTLHDMWGFCGAEHLSWDNRYINGYNAHNRPEYESGFDLNRWTWKRKKRHWKNAIHIVTPSKWLGDCVSESDLMKEWPVSVIPNTLDTDQWKPVDQNRAKDLLRVDREKLLLVFGALGGTKNLHKGADLLFKALNSRKLRQMDIQLLVFGENKPEYLPDVPFSIKYLGHLNDDISLKIVYSAADAFVIPSRQDNLPNGGLEAHSCGTPVVAFQTCGLNDIVTHKKTGWLAKAFDPGDLATGIFWTLNSKERRKELSKNARNKSVDLWSNEKVVPLYLSAYEKAMSRMKV